MRNADQHHLAGADRPAGGLHFGNSLEQHLPAARQHAQRQRLRERRAAPPFILRKRGIGRRRRNEAQPRHQMREFGEVGEDGGRIGAGVVLGAKLVQRGGRVTLHQMLEQVDDAAAIAEAQHLADRIGGDRAAAMGDRLVEYRQAIAGRAFGGTRDHGERGVVDLDRFQSRDPGEMGDQQLGVDAPEVEALAARQHGDRHLADLGGGEDELHMRRRLLERLQKAVEGLRREHVHFVDDVDLVARRHRRVAHLLDDLADVVDAGVRGGVHLDHVDMAAFHDGGAVLADFVELDRRLVDGRRSCSSAHGRGCAPSSSCRHRARRSASMPGRCGRRRKRWSGCGPSAPGR